MNTNYLDLGLYYFLGIITEHPDYIDHMFGELSEIEIYNYLDNITQGFDKNRLEIIQKDIEVYYNMEFLERINEDSMTSYKLHNWEIPTYKKNTLKKEHKLNKILKDVTFIDYKTMRMKTHPFVCWNINNVRHILKTKLTELTHKTEQENNKYPNIFTDENYQLFNYLDTEYTQDNNTLKAKYSYIYHFMMYEHRIMGTQKIYIEFIEKEKGETLSKILPKQYKYDDHIQPLLTSLLNNFNELNRKE